MKRLLGALVLMTGLSSAQASPLAQTPPKSTIQKPSVQKLALTRPVTTSPASVTPLPKKPSPAAAVYRFIESRAGKRVARQLTPVIVDKAQKYGLPPVLVAKVIYRESSFRPHVELHRCYGLMQVAYFHFKAGENPYDPATNVDAGCRVLSKYYGRFRNWPQALTAYNFGPTATVSRGLGTSRYARQVMAGK